MRLLAPLLLPCIIASTTVASTASGQDPAATAQHLLLDPIQPPSPLSPFLTIDSCPRTQAIGWSSVSASLLLNYARAPLTVHQRTSSDSDLSVGSPVKNLLLAHPAAGARVSEHVSVDLTAPVSLFQNGTDTPVGQNTVRAGSPKVAPGDLRLGVLVQPWLQPHLGVVTGFRASSPTGSASSYMSDHRFHAELLVGAYTTAGPARLACTSYISPAYFAARYGDRLAVGCATDLTFAAGIPSVGAEALWASKYLLDDTSPTSIAEVWGTVRHQIGPITAAVAAGPGITSSPGTAEWRLLASVGFVPHRAVRSRGPDSNSDGVRDASVPTVPCPAEAGALGSDPQRRNCTNLDTDGDGIRDGIDACPLDRGLARKDPSISGCPDADNDHIIDKSDKCPAEPAEADPGSDSYGCPKRVHLREDVFVADPSLDASGSPYELQALKEIAFSIDADSSILRVSVEVRLQGLDNDDQLVERAAERANLIVSILVSLGVDRRRLQAVGSVSPAPPKVEVRIVQRARREHH